MTNNRKNMDRLSTIYIQMYESQIKRGMLGDSTISTIKATTLLSRWNSIVDKKYNWLRLDEKERNTLMDALIDDEDWTTPAV